jgi:hypothetical protein
LGLKYMKHLFAISLYTTVFFLLFVGPNRFGLSQRQTVWWVRFQQGMVICRTLQQFGFGLLP